MNYYSTYLKYFEKHKNILIEDYICIKPGDIKELVKNNKYEKTKYFVILGEWIDKTYGSFNSSPDNKFINNICLISHFPIIKMAGTKFYVAAIHHQSIGMNPDNFTNKTVNALTNYRNRMNSGKY
jgi:hypothetical protein